MLTLISTAPCACCGRRHSVQVNTTLTHLRPLSFLSSSEMFLEALLFLSSKKSYIFGSVENKHE